MAKSKSAPAPEPPAAAAAAAEYTVVARRYRPQQFAELIGQEHVAKALVNALQSGRVAHAYLFTGARGVGKTSAARILAKALNCETGPTATPCDRCDSCLAIAAGEDVDVLEIDGASNNKVEEVRDLRQNVGFRPTRGRYKIYIIDEVHMLTTNAFNALLKTLEEPPEHVKFILATTEVQKIPITILSRCQRFDFAHVGAEQIFEQLKRVVGREGYEADDAALRLIARRAGGSMRDSQSLLDQLLASGEGRLTADHVQAVLGAAGDERVVELAGAILARDAKAALNLLAGWIDRGLQVGELVDQLIEHWRALMLLSCAPDLRDLPVAPGVREVLHQQAGKSSLDTILAGLDVWTATKARMRGSNHTQVLLEMAVVRLCRMDELLPVAQLLQALDRGEAGRPPQAAGRVAAPATDSAKKNGQQALVEVRFSGNNGVNGSPASGALPLTADSVSEVWSRLLLQLADKAPILAAHLKSALIPAIFGPNSLVIRFTADYNHQHDACKTEPNVNRIREALQKITGHPVNVRVELTGDAPGAGTRRTAPDAPPGVGTERRKQDLMRLPLFKKAAEVLGATIRHVDDDFNPHAAPPPSGDDARDDDEDALAAPADPEEA